MSAVRRHGAGKREEQEEYGAQESDDDGIRKTRTTRTGAVATAGVWTKGQRKEHVPLSMIDVQPKRVDDDPDGAEKVGRSVGMLVGWCGLVWFGRSAKGGARNERADCMCTCRGGIARDRPEPPEPWGIR